MALTLRGLNPFRAGRCLSTEILEFIATAFFSLNPFRAGRCLSTVKRAENLDIDLPSQSLSSRAMSFDKNFKFKYLNIIKSLNPFRAGRCLSTS